MQQNIPSPSYTTTQMRETAEKGLIDARVMEYQAYINHDDLKGYHFIPFVVRHDNPLYATAACTADERAVLSMFADFCKTDEIQKMAADVGFNAFADYPGSDLDAVLAAAQMLMEKKEELQNAKLMMFLLSDGEQIDGYSYDKVAPVIEGLHIPIHTICYGTDIDEMKELSMLNEASNIQASPDDVVYNLKNMFNAQM